MTDYSGVLVMKRNPNVIARGGKQPPNPPPAPVAQSSIPVPPKGSGQCLVTTEVGDYALLTRPHLLDETVIDEVVRRDCYGLLSVRMRGATVLDLGAHIGVFSTRCAQLGAERVIAVEPEPGNLAVLRQNIAAWPQITLVEKAVGTEGDCTTQIRGESGGAHTGWSSDPDGIEVEQVTLASLIDEYGPIDLLKLDMEGGEVGALLACDHDRLSRVKRIVMETHGPAICPWVERPRVGELVEHLLYTHNVEASGFPTHLGLLFAARNGCDHGWPT